MSVTVFLDKDGTLLEDIPYNVDPQRMRLAPLGDRALRLLAEYDCRVVVVSNQSGVARGYFSESSLERVEDWLRTVFRRFGVDFAGFYYCPHHPEGDVAEFAIECDCRKPGDGMLRRAAADLGIAMASGTNIAIESADIVIPGDRVSAVAETIEIARLTLRTIRQNLFFAFFYNAAAIPAAAFGLLGPHGPIIAAIAMAASDITVVGNALRLRATLRAKRT